MPKLHNLYVIVVDLQAQSVLDMASLHTLTLHVLCLNVTQDFSIELPPASHLRFLKVESSKVKYMTLIVSNPDVELRTKGFHTVIRAIINRIRQHHDFYV